MSADAGPPIAGPLAPGASIAPGYEVIRHLSRGRALDTYDCWSERRDCRCVAKLLRPDRLADRAARRRLRREGTLALELRHPHIVEGYELLARPQPAVILETLDGETVGHMIATARRRLAISELAFLGMHLCSAMHYLHGCGFLHIDLKPSNVISDFGQAKVIDLSLARRPGPGRRGVGTRSYMAPEQARGGRLSAATDVWGIGAVLFEAAAGLAPFAAHQNGARYPQLDHRAPRVGTLRRLPRALGAAIDASLEPEPRERPAVGELSAALDPFG